MAKIINRFDATFTAIGQQVSLSMPERSEEVAIRVYREQAQLSLFILVDQPNLTSPTYMRNFVLVPADQVLPDNYKKYIATIPFGPTEIQTHIIEVTV